MRIQVFGTSHPLTNGRDTTLINSFPLTLYKITLSRTSTCRFLLTTAARQCRRPFWLWTFWRKIQNILLAIYWFQRERDSQRTQGMVRTAAERSISSIHIRLGRSQSKRDLRSSMKSFKISGKFTINPTSFIGTRYSSTLPKRGLKILLLTFRTEGIMNRIKTSK